MTELLKKAFEEASKLDDQDQNAFAELMLDELASERRWVEAFRNSQKQLERLADAAEKEFDEGKTRPLSELL